MVTFNSRAHFEDEIKKVIEPYLNKSGSAIKFDHNESNLMREALKDHLINLKINNAAPKKIQYLQQIIDKIPNGE